MRYVLVDLSHIVHTLFHSSGSDAEADYISNQTVAQVRGLLGKFDPEQGPDRIVICCDSKNYFRKQISSEYKANREAKPAYLYFQADRAKQILRDDGYPVLEVDGFEADDVIATCVTHLSTQSGIDEVLIYTTDKDLLALVRDDTAPRVCVYSFRTQSTLTEKDVVAKFGVPPSQMTDLLALMGDASDNVPGCRGIGKKTGAELLQKFGTLDDLYLKQIEAGKSAEEMGIHAGIHAKLKANGQQVAVSKQLVQLRHDVPIDVAQLLAERVPKRVVELDPVEPVPESGEVVTEQKAEEVVEMDNVGTTVVEEQVVDPSTGEVTVQQVAVQEQVRPAVTQLQPQRQKPLVKVQPQSDFERLMAEPPSWEKGLEPGSSEGAAKLANHLWKSGMFGNYANEDAILSTILFGRGLGLGAMASLQSVHIVPTNGGAKKHCPSADLMVALILKSHLCEYFRPVKITPESVVYCTKRVGDPEFTMEFTIEEARQANLVKDGSGWVKYPKDMLRARCIARLARTKYPDVVAGLYTPEEMRDARIGEVAA